VIENVSLVKDMAKFHHVFDTFHSLLQMITSTTIGYDFDVRPGSLAYIEADQDNHFSANIKRMHSHKPPTLSPPASSQWAK
jgi:hypothetical protein